MKHAFALVLLVLALVGNLLGAVGTAVPGQSVSFGVTAGGTQPFSYQWKKDGVAIAGATGSQLVLASATPADAGVYSVTVSNAAGSTNSDTATLAVITPPNNAKVTVTVAIAATGSPSFQWKKGTRNIPGATTPVLALTDPKSTYTLVTAWQPVTK